MREREEEEEEVEVEEMTNLSSVGGLDAHFLFSWSTRAKGGEGRGDEDGGDEEEKTKRRRRREGGRDGV